MNVSLTKSPEIDPATVAAARQAVMTIYSFRTEMADTLVLQDWLYWVKDEAHAAKKSGRRIASDVWVELAIAADDLCDDDGLPRLFRPDRHQPLPCPCPCPATTGDTDRTEQYEMNAAAIATAIWEISTGNGRDLNRDDWHSHMQNCHAEVANSYTDGITQAAWHKAALARAV